jgi:hypothetical protein
VRQVHRKDAPVPTSPHCTNWPNGQFLAVGRTLTCTVGDLASDEAVRLRCDCRVRTYGRAELAALVGRDARLYLVDLHRDLRCREYGEPPLRGWIVTTMPKR